MTILELPGHGDEIDKDIADLKHFLSWFEDKIAELDAIIIIAHSMGANLAPYLATHCHKIQQLILLDGGYFDLDSLVSLEDETAGTEHYLESGVFENVEMVLSAEKENSPYWSQHLEKAVQISFQEIEGLYRLKLNRSAIFHLLKLQRQTQGWLDKVGVPTLLIPQRLEAPQWKLTMLEKIPKQITVDKKLQLGHSPHTEKPEQVAQVIKEFIASNPKSVR
ncbi:alpha/beta hydrolase [Streptococcus sp. X16XC17]|uniref:alpha/beta fold hydrolase n=1 Tax=unclassified Streptococcus TaxID=2608887 RepID=UPI00066FEBB4|nr:MULTISPECIES: alpha/beta hydrolase [unclassified Streptococcus]TCD45551.1 alpha/beta hydrolase [Streptococcus sp. X16XC17]